jgi:hypothetical protein
LSGSVNEREMAQANKHWRSLEKTSAIAREQTAITFS